MALVRGLRGLRGQVRVELLTDRPEDRFTVGARLHPEGSDEVLIVDDASAVADGPGWWLTFHEIRSREAAERLRDLYLEIDAPAEPREPGRWFWHELEGLAVRTGSGEDLGTIKEIYRAGGAEVFVVRGPRGELDVPGVKGIVLDLAPDRGEMIVDLEALALDARPVDDEDYVRPRDRRPKKQPKPKGPAQPAPKDGSSPRGAKPASKGGSSSPPSSPKAAKAVPRKPRTPRPTTASSPAAASGSESASPEPPAPDA